MTPALFADAHPFLCYGDFAEAYFENSASLLIKWEEGRVETLSRSHDDGVGLRYLADQETRFGALSRPFDRARLLALSQMLGGGLPSLKPKDYALAAIKKHPVSVDPRSISLDQKVALLREVFLTAYSGPHIRQVEITYGEKHKTVGILNSEGHCSIEERNYLVFSIRITVARNKDLQTAYESIGGVVGFELLDSAQIKRLAAMVSERAHKKLDAPQAPVGEMPVVIASSAGGTLIHEAIGHSLEADAVFEGSSPAYVGKLGQVVANPKLTVLDNPTVSRARGSFYFDDEGVPAEQTVLIENGILKNYLFDRLSARRAGRASNGHGRRESYRHRPIPRMSNTYVMSGQDDPKNIIQNFRDGFLVTKMGGGQVNPANGDFVFEVEEGYHVKNGRRTLVRGATLLGNGPQLLFDIDHVGNDHGWAIGTCGKEGQGVPVSDALPTVHIKKMLIGGGAG